MTQSIYTSFELSYSFEGLRKESDVIDRGYAVRVVKMMRKFKGLIEGWGDKGANSENAMMVDKNKEENGEKVMVGEVMTLFVR